MEQLQLDSLGPMMTVQCFPNRVKCRGQGLTFGYVGQPITSTIDTRKAGPGELIVSCAGPSPELPAFCELKDKDEGEGSGVFVLIVRAQDYGMHRLYIRYNQQDVNGSPFPLRVSSASLLTFDGSGLRGGILSRFDPEFIINTEKAGKGDIKVKIGGPRGAFRMKTRVIGKTIYCSYNVTEPGEYIIQVLWCGDPVPDSPFHVFVWKTVEDLMIHQQQYTTAQPYLNSAVEHNYIY